MKFNLFVYGTLRRGEYNDRGLFARCDNFVSDVRYGGAMRNVSGDAPVYPVVDFDGEGTVLGDVLYGLDMDDGPVKSVLAMESGAGYELRLLTPADAVPVYGFHYPRFERAGCPIPDGDWVAWSAGRKGVFRCGCFYTSSGELVECEEHWAPLS